MHTSAGEEKFN